MIICTKFKTVKKGTLQGYAELYHDGWKVDIPGCALHMKDGKRWVNVPSKEFKNDHGEKIYVPLFRFREKKDWENFITQAKKAIDDFCMQNRNTQND